jgi:hypothetical protein
MTALAHIDDAILEHDVDDLLLQARGLVLVREILARRGASRAELDVHTRELERVRHELAGTIEPATATHGATPCWAGSRP